jgi:hypothetical protein
MHLSIPAFDSIHHILSEVHAKVTLYVIEAPSLLACLNACISSSMALEQFHINTISSLRLTIKLGYVPQQLEDEL